MMSKPNLPMLSKDSYYSFLIAEDKERYDKKLRICLSDVSVTVIDPYCLESIMWDFDPVKWPKIEMSHIIGYFIQRPGLYSVNDLQNYRSLEAFDFVLSNKISPVGSIAVCSENTSSINSVYLRAEVGHSQSLSTSPLHVWLRVKTNGTIECAHCTCTAG